VPRAAASNPQEAAGCLRLVQVVKSTDRDRTVQETSCPALGGRAKTIPDAKHDNAQLDDGDIGVTARSLSQALIAHWEMLPGNFHARTIVMEDVSKQPRRVELKDLLKCFVNNAMSPGQMRKKGQNS
jgi:hypothetical protein